jgi:hypothetical protein
MRYGDVDLCAGSFEGPPFVDEQSVDGSPATTCQVCGHVVEIEPTPDAQDGQRIAAHDKSGRTVQVD